jgi:hypothetical protein
MKNNQTKKMSLRSVAMMKKLPLALAVAASAVSSAQAYQTSVGDVNIQLDNTISYGIGWRVSERDEGQIMAGNGELVGVNGKGSSYNYDDGTLNYDQGDIYTNVFKWSSDLEISYENYGGFFRGRAYYDHAIMDQDTEFKPLNDAAKDQAGLGAELLDAFVWADYDINYVPVTFRLGRQVLSWGESTFIQGGINSINPVDASAFRKPGAELKEGLLPVNMFYTSIGLTGDVTLEAFYQLEWEKTRIDPCGTFFSTADFVADGCGPVILSGTEDELTYLALRDAEIEEGTPLSERLAPITERLADDEPSDSGQYGVAVRWYAEALGDTEFGFYYMNLHSRLPYINGVTNNYDTAGLITGTAGAQVNADAEYDSRYPLYQIVYPEDIKIMGISFARSTEDGASISGEVSYRPDAPVQWNAFEQIVGGLGIPYSRLFQARKQDLIDSGLSEEEATAAGFDRYTQSFDEFDIWQAQSTYIKFFDRVLGADRLALVGEVGMTYVPDLPDVDDARYGRSGAYGIGNNSGVFDGSPDTNACVDGPAENANPDYCTNDGYTTKLSGGIRLRSGLTYNNAFAGVNMTPNLSIAYDKGYGPEPGAQFIDDRLTVGLGVSFLYLNQTSVDVSYTNFSGGKYNQLKDRDNISLSAKYSF